MVVSHGVVVDVVEVVAVVVQNFIVRAHDSSEPGGQCGTKHVVEEMVDAAVGREENVSTGGSIQELLHKRTEQLAIGHAVVSRVYVLRASSEKTRNDHIPCAFGEKHTCTYGTAYSKLMAHLSSSTYEGRRADFGVIRLRRSAP